MTSLQMGETMHNIAKDMDTYSYTLPLGKANEEAVRKFGDLKAFASCG